ncbi:MAG: cob(I)yrinic acid a,c-diamide adenosyltransferase [Candidatus Levybacteria bacterium]|nr:cob(I)yrinic acid a,c-diamide adenosyltransferase [Candidatus Levybacteria bacterium]
MPIYTRKGDKGKTSLFGGIRISKNNIRVEAYGTVDELNCSIGMAIVEISNIKNQISKIKDELIKIQNDLLDIGSNLANPESKALPYLEKRVEEFEDQIDEMTEKMPPLRNFILPGGGKTGALLHFARTVCRRGERGIVELDKSEKIDIQIIMYMNRLSDLLFTMARFVNFQEKKKEVIWIKK